MYAINFVDYFSGVIAVYFLENGSSPEIVSAVRAFLRDYAHLLTDTRNPGVMDEWLTDNASYFTSELTDELCITLSIQEPSFTARAPLSSTLGEIGSTFSSGPTSSASSPASTTSCRRTEAPALSHGGSRLSRSPSATLATTPSRTSR